MTAAAKSKTAEAHGLQSALVALRDLVAAVSFRLDAAGVDEARVAQREIVNQLDDYVLPRLARPKGPLLVVVAGPTGSGKSTLVNTLAGSMVTTTGVRRPTTSNPVLVCHPDERQWFDESAILPQLPRADAPTQEAALIHTTSNELPPGLALLDTPDFDSIVIEHHAVARRLLAAADLWLFVTSAARYADAPGWQMLNLAMERGAQFGLVLDRVPEQAVDEVTEHFQALLAEHDCGEAEVFAVPEAPVENGQLAAAHVKSLKTWLLELASDTDKREKVMRATLDGALDSFRTRVGAVASYLEAQLEIRAALWQEVESTYASALDEIDEGTRNGSLLRGEVLARWQDFVGTGELLQALEVRRRGQRKKRRQHSPPRAQALKAALRIALESLVVSTAGHAAEEASRRWAATEAGAALLGKDHATLSQASSELVRHATRAISAWQDYVVELVRAEGVTKRSVAKLLFYEEESVALVLCVALFGFGTSDVAVESGTSAVPQRLLQGLFGAEALRNIAAKVRTDLRTRLGMLLDEEAIRFAYLLDAAGVPHETAAMRLYQAIYNLEVAR